jgi:hypothetical protein
MAKRGQICIIPKPEAAHTDCNVGSELKFFQSNIQGGVSKKIPIPQTDAAAQLEAIHPHMKDFVSVIQSLDDESPRGMVLTLSGSIEEVLKRLLTIFLRHGTNVDELFEGTGPLSSFSSRIKMAQALSLVSDAEASKLNIIRGLRNDFAHQPGASFDVPSMMDRAKSLSDKGETSRMQYQFAAVTIIIGILRRLNHFEKNRRLAMDPRLEATWEDAPGLPPEAKLISRGGHE